VISKQQDFELGREKARCYLIRAQTRGSEIELWVDQQRFVILQYKEKSKSPDTHIEIAMKLKLVELNQEVGDSLFHLIRILNGPRSGRRHAPLFSPASAPRTLL
jgi:outer membrane lipoprotein-sorting protein